MAKYNKSDVVMGGKCEIPKDRYRARVIGTKLGKSSKGHSMTTLTCEIIAPEEVVVNNTTYRIAGRQFSLWLMNVPSETWGLSRVFEFMDKLGIDYGDEYDEELHKEYFLGWAFDIVLSSEEDVMKKPDGTVITDGENRPISNGYRINGDLQNVPEFCAPELTELSQNPV